MSKSNESNATAYIDAWSRKDLDGIATHLHPAVHFKGPMQELVRFEDGLVRDTELFFDARPFEAMQRAQAAGIAPK